MRERAPKNLKIPELFRNLEVENRAKHVFPLIKKRLKNESFNAKGEGNQPQTKSSFLPSFFVFFLFFFFFCYRNF